MTYNLPLQTMVCFSRSDFELFLGLCDESRPLYCVQAVVQEKSLLHSFQNSDSTKARTELNMFEN